MYNDILLQLKNRRPFPNKWNGPGSKLEVGELIYNGMLREIFEETGLKLSDMLKIVYLLTIRIPHQNLILYVYAIQLNNEAKPQQIEGEKLQWFDVNDLENMNESLAGDGGVF